MDNDDLTGASRTGEPNETALRVLNLLFILNSSSTPLTTERSSIPCLVTMRSGTRTSYAADVPPGTCTKP